MKMKTLYQGVGLARTHLLNTRAIKEEYFSHPHFQRLFRVITSDFI